MKKLNVPALIFMIMISSTIVFAQQSSDNNGYNYDSGASRKGHHRKIFFDPEKMKTKLGLTDDQVDKITSINLEYKNEFVGIKQKLSPMKKQLKQLFLADPINRESIKEQLKAIADLKIQIKMLRIDQWLDIEKILTDAQKAKLKEERMKRIKAHQDKKRDNK